MPQRLSHRKLLAEEYDRLGYTVLAAAIRAKKLDKDDEVKAALAAMRRLVKMTREIS